MAKKTKLHAINNTYIKVQKKIDDLSVCFRRHIGLDAKLSESHHTLIRRTVNLILKTIHRAPKMTSRVLKKMKKINVSFFTVHPFFLFLSLLNSHRKRVTMKK